MNNLVIAVVLLAFGLGLALVERAHRGVEPSPPCCYPGTTSCYDDARWGLLHSC